MQEIYWYLNSEVVVCTNVAEYCKITDRMKPVAAVVTEFKVLAHMVIITASQQTCIASCSVEVLGVKKPKKTPQCHGVTL